MDDYISRQAAIEAVVDCTNCGTENVLREYVIKHSLENGWTGGIVDALDAIEQLPSAQPEIIHCNSCKYWTQSTGKMKGYGLGRCDFHDADLVTCNGFCYWAERRNDG